MLLPWVILTLLVLLVLVLLVIAFSIGADLHHDNDGTARANGSLPKPSTALPTQYFGWEVDSHGS